MYVVGLVDGSLELTFVIAATNGDGRYLSER